MPEAAEPAVQQPTQTDATKIELGDIIWESPAGKEAIQTTAQQQAAVTVQPTVTPDPQEQLVDEFEYLEQQTGFKNWDEVKALKTEAEQLRLKIQNPIAFANDDSRKFLDAIAGGKEDELYDYLHNKRVLSKAADLTPAEAIRLHLQYTNKHYKPEDIEDVFEERYSVPKKPVQGENEEVDQFNERMTEYNARVGKVNRAIERDGVQAKEALSKMKPELIIPDIPKEPVRTGPSEEDLQNRRKFVEAFATAVPTAISGFTGFSANFKDEVVEIPIAYVVTDEEKAGIKLELENFAKEDLNANVFLAKRWLNPDGSVNITQIAKDRYLLNNQDKIFNKLVQEAGAKRLAHERKLKSNIDVSGKQPAGTFNPSDKPAELQLEEAVWSMK